MTPILPPEPQPVPTTAPPHHPARDAGSGGLAVTLLTAAVIAIALLWLLAPWKRSKLPRARASIRPEPDGSDGPDGHDDAS